MMNAYGWWWSYLYHETTLLYLLGVVSGTSSAVHIILKKTGQMSVPKHLLRALRVWLPLLWLLWHLGTI